MKKHIILFSVGASISLYCVSNSFSSMRSNTTNSIDTTIIDSAIYPIDTTINKMESIEDSPKNTLLEKEREKRRKARAKYKKDKQVQP